MIELLLLDVDGTLTDGKIYYSNQNEEIKAFNIKDGLALRVWKKLGRKSAIITGRQSMIVQKRAEELGIDFVFMGVENKGDVVLQLKKDLNLTQGQIASIGDDLNDLSMFNQSGLSFSPRDGAKQILNEVSYVLEKNGGEGAVREMIEMILKQEQLEEKWLEFFS